MRHIAFLTLIVSTLFAEVKFLHRTCDYATHQPVLYEMVMRTTGPIIEFGCGDGSTDLLHELCRETGRTLITVEDDFLWMSKFTKKYWLDGYEEDNSGWHKFFYVFGKHDHEDPRHWIRFLDRFELLETMEFDVCFIDQDPWLARYETLKRLKDKAKYIIVHDCDYFPGKGIFGKVVTPHQKEMPGTFDFSDVFRHFKVYYPLTPWPYSSGPPTLLGSNFDEDLPEIDYGDY